jgi:3-methyladenine DNA glycosylase AlkD
MGKTPRNADEVATLAGEISAQLRALDSHSAESIRNIRRAYSMRIAKNQGRDVLAVALSVLAAPSPGARFVAYELVAHHRGALQSLKAADLARFGRGLASWGAVDAFSCYVAGPAWRERQVPDSLIARWAASRDRWWRRAALVSTVPLNTKSQGGHGDPERTLSICLLLLDDRDDMVVKALSWALRSLAKRDPEAVHAFVVEHEHRLAARVLREVRNKLRTGKKNPRR